MWPFSLFKRKRHSFHTTSFSSYRSGNASVRSLRSQRAKPIKSALPPRHGEGTLQKVVKILKLILILALILAALYTIFLTGIFEVQKVDVLGGADTTEEQSALNTELQTYLGENILLINTREIESTLSEKYPYLKTISINRVLLHSIEVTLETYAKAANVRVDSSNGSKYFVLNEEGFVIGTDSAIETLPTIISDSTFSATGLNQILIPKETLSLILGTAKSFQDKFAMGVTEIHYLKEAREVHLLTERNFYIWIDLNSDTEKQLLKLKKTLSALNIYEANLQYIDLRISGQNGEKVIYMENQ